MIRKLLISLFVLLLVVVLAAVVAVNVIDPNDYREDIAEQASKQLDRPVALNGPLAFKLFPGIALEINDVTVGNPEGFPADLALAKVGSAVASVQLLPLLSGQVKIGDVTLQGASVNLVTLASGRSNLDGLGASEAEVAAVESATAEAQDISAVSTGAVSFRDLRLSMVDLAANARQNITIERLDLDPFSAGQDVGFSMGGTITADDQPLVENLSIDGLINVAADLSRIVLPSLQLSADLPGADADIEIETRGEVSSLSPLRIKLENVEAELESGELEAVFAGALDVAMEPTPRLQLAQSTLTVNDQQLTLQGDVVVGEPSSFKLDVGGDRLDLRPFSQASASAATSTTASAETSGAAAGGEEQPLDLSVLRQWRMDVNLRLGQVVLPNVELNDVVGTLRGRDGLLTLDPLQARLFNGQFNGSASIDARQNPPRVRLQPRLEGIAVQSLLGVITESAPARGDGSLRLDIEFAGLDVQQALQSLDGQGEFELLDGALIGVDLNRLLNEELSRSNFGNVSQAFGGETVFESLSGRFDAQSGILTLPAVNMDTLQFGLSGTGKVDLPQQQLNYNLDLKLGEQLRGTLPERLVDLTNGVIPLSVSGSITEPTVTVNLENLAQRAVEKEVRKQGSRLLERLFNRGDDEEEEASDDSQSDGGGG
ncbi:MAG: AsmA family protein [Wenzhouxiangellaceae bacterium]